MSLFFRPTYRTATASRACSTAAPGGYQGAKAVARTGTWKLEILKRTELHRFVVLPKRWVVERAFAWIARNRRLARDFERY
ncbi:MAG: hypothetical protein ACREER_13595, partial [Alphaproteobacteria bacterium]